MCAKEGLIFSADRDDIDAVIVVAMPFGTAAGSCSEWLEDFYRSLYHLVFLGDQDEDAVVKQQPFSIAVCKYPLFEKPKLVFTGFKKIALAQPSRRVGRICTADQRRFYMDGSGAKMTSGLPNDLAITGPSAKARLSPDN